MTRLESVGTYLLLLLGATCVVIGLSLMGCGGDAAADRPLKAEAAAVLASEIELGSKDGPAPNPVGGICPNCKGKGKVGDGTIMVPCKPCDGTGKVKTSEAPPREDIDDTKVPPTGGEEEAWPERQAYQAFPGGDFEDDEYWCPSRHILWRLAEGAPREGESLWRDEGGDLIYWRQPLREAVDLHNSTSSPERGWRLFRFRSS